MTTTKKYVLWGTPINSPSHKGVYLNESTTTPEYYDSFSLGLKNAALFDTPKKLLDAYNNSVQKGGDILNGDYFSSIQPVEIDNATGKRTLLSENALKKLFKT